MFDISFTELMLLGVVALIVIGPERLPKVARTVGHLLGRAQRYVNDVKTDIQREVELEDLRKIKEEMETAAHGVRDSLQDAASTFRDGVSKPVEELKKELDTATRDLNKVIKEGGESAEEQSDENVVASEKPSSPVPTSSEVTNDAVAPAIAEDDPFVVTDPLLDQDEATPVTETETTVVDTTPKPEPEPVAVGTPRLSKSDVEQKR